MEATGVSVADAQPSTSGAISTQMIVTQLKLQGVVVSCCEPDPCGILDLFPEETENLGEINMRQADELLRDEGAAMIEALVQECNRAIEAERENQSLPELEAGFSIMELEDGEYESEASMQVMETEIALHQLQTMALQLTQLCHPRTLRCQRTAVHPT